ncbi:hypothetical protein ORL93_09925 [Bacillus sp. DHT2]|uniref:hypothetical protein n=2 Tax=Bacillus TaxID=1386 RepID=UPI002867D56C|nr:hypothetical protein [Bacillus pseudomycoides]MCX2826113.1 hypothetical protein [Bacillus sp. DHT2]
MKIIVPAKGKDSTYQVVIIDDVLNKAELEKIMISFLFEFERNLHVIKEINNL